MDIIKQVIQGALESERGLFLWNNQLSNTTALLRRIQLSLLFEEFNDNNAEVFEYETKVYYG